MWVLDHKEGWEPKNWYFQIVVLEKTLESLLDSKKIKAVNPKGNQPWTFIGRTNAEAGTAIFWPTDAKSWFIGKDLDVGKDWGQEEKGATEDEMIGWHHWLNGHEFEQTLADGERQGSLVCAVHGIAKSQTWLSDWTASYGFSLQHCNCGIQTAVSAVFCAVSSWSCLHVSHQNVASKDFLSVGASCFV